jgi:lipopolysaccharide/colanic/teichoic acid biosynthesis glycosyltransferase
LKRGIDIVGATAALVILSPVLATIGLLVLLTSGRPVFFKQRRVGMGFRPFWLWKFRTMRNGQTGPAVTVAGDQRITSLGKALRAGKLDELPQLWNVLRGDMSLVGPRPELPQYVEHFKSRYVNVLTIRPGLTDLASIQFRNEEQILAASNEPMRAYVDRLLPEKLDLAEEYVRTHNLRADLNIMLRTAAVVIRGR